MENNPVKTRRSHRWAITIGLIIGTLCVTAFAFLYKLPSVAKFEADSAGIHVDQPNGAFLSVATQNEEAAVPFLRTGFDKTFFTIDSENKVTFYEYAKEKFQKIDTTKEIKVTLPYGKEKALVSIAILEKDGKCEGYGVFTNTESVKLPYVFVKLISNTVTKDAYEYLLYVDYTIDDFYKNAKNYSALYAFSTKDNSLEPIFSNVGATAGPNGLINESFVLIPGDFAGVPADGFYYLTDRNYAPGTAYDLYKKTSVKGKEETVYEGVAAPYLFLVKDEVCFFTKAESEDATGTFKLSKMGEDGIETIRTYSGSPEQYLVRGNHILNPAAKTICNISTGKNDGIRTNISINTVQDFVVNDSGTKLALAGIFAGNSEKLFFYNLANDRSATIDGADLFVSNHSNLSFLDDSVYIVMPSKTLDKISNFVISWDAVFSIN